MAHYNINDFMNALKKRSPGEPEFFQAVEEILESAIPVVNANKDYQDARILERITEPDRSVAFRVTWTDDQGNVQVNKGYRVQFSNAIGPYKGGLRFHPSVNLSILKFLGFEQIFKNSLTTLPMGGGKGGSNFDPKGKSDAEVMRFCQAFMSELFRHIGPETDVPAGDIGVGGREIGFLYGQYKKLTNTHTGVLTGKGLNYGGSLIRPEATGYGCVYFAQNMLRRVGDDFQGKTCLVSGSGNVAQYCTEKLIELGGKVVTLSDSGGFIYDPEGITTEKLAYVMELKNERRGRIKEYAEKFGVEYFEGQRPWSLEANMAFPCATQNEILIDDAKMLVKNGVKLVAEGANMPTSMEGVHYFREHKILYAPGKASNAGGVATSGLEMSQNALRINWTREEVDARLQSIMSDIHSACVQEGYAGNGHGIDYVKGANVAGFKKIAEALISQGVV